MFGSDVRWASLPRVPKPFLLLERQVIHGLQPHPQSGPGRTDAPAAESKLRESRAIKGLVILRMILHYYQTNKTSGLVYDITDLPKVSMKGNNAENFQNTWTQVPRGMRKPPDPEVMEVLYFKCV